MEQNSHPAAGPPSPPRLRRPVRVIGETRLWIVCKSIERVVTHWIGDRDVFCALHQGAAICPHCVAEHPVSVQHWLMVQDFRPRSGPALLRLTPGAVDHCPKLTFRDGDLYARLIEVGRRTGTVRGPMYAVLHDTEDIPPLEGPVEVLPSLKRLIGSFKRRGTSGPSADGDGR